jgi:hypothetical protein
VPTTEAQTAETTAPVVAVAEPVTETKEAEKAVEKPAAPVQPEEKLAEKVEQPLKQEAKVEAPLTEESTVQDIVDKTQATKAGQLPELETESEGKG